MKFKNATIFLEVFVFYCFLLSGLMKWSPFFPIDPTLLFGLLCVPPFITKLAKKQSYNYLVVPLGLILFVWLVFSCTYGLSKNYYQYKLLQTSLVFFGLFYPIVVFRKEIYLKMVIHSLTLLTFIALALLVLLYQITGGDQNIYGVLADTRQFGSKALPDYLAIGDLLVTFILVNFFNKNRVIRAMQILSFLFLIWLAGRGPLIGLVLISLLAYLASFKLNVKSIFLGFLLFVATLTSYVYIINWEGSDRIQERFSSASDGSDGGIEERILLSETAIKSIDENPLLGIGFGSFGLYYSNVDERNYPHNMFLEILCETGLIGFLLLLFLVLNYLGIILFQFMLRGTSQHKVYIGFPLASLSLLMQSMKASSICDLRFTFSFIGLIIITHYVIEKKNSTIPLIS
jgi:O-antigen ligase